MLIGKIQIGDAPVRRIDAQSRLAIWAANHSNSPLISKLGLTHISGGVVNAFGTKMLRADGPGLVLEKIEPVQVSGLITWAMPMQPMILQRCHVDHVQ